jgi:hypothetical protein
MEKENTQKELLQVYLSLWNNRGMEAETEAEASLSLRELIRRELLDENSHPRIRKTKEDKLQSGLMRLEASGLNRDLKDLLSDLYKEIFHSL